jgi:two-component sensor histidine kinase
VRLDLDLQEVFLGLDAAISCGLIVNELVSNSLKHAFSGDPGLSASPGQIRIEFHRSDSGSFSLSVSDNGCGFPPGINFRQTESLGLQLVRVLTEQIGGSIELDSTAGTKFLITFT